MTDINNAQNLTQIALHHFNNGLGEVFAGAVIGIAGTYAGYAIRRVRQGRNVLSGNLKTPDILLSRTVYTPSGYTNPETRNEFFYQDVRSVDPEKHAVKLEDFLTSGAEIPLARAIKKAAKFCTPDAPVVLAHLHKAVKPSEIGALVRVLPWGTVGEFSDRLSDLHHAMAANHDEREYVTERHFTPVLLNEKYGKENHLRFLLVEPWQFNAKKLPDPRDILCPVVLEYQQLLNSFGQAGKSIYARRHTDGHVTHYVHDPEHRQADRILTHQKIAALDADPRNAWMRNLFTVARTTHEIQAVVPFVAPPAI